MLCQLVCVDRRYQRMNCFNIRELQGILKRRFFTDLINSNDFRQLMEASMIGLRFKSNNNLSGTPNSFAFYNFGVTNSSKSKNYVMGSTYNTFTGRSFLNHDSLQGKLTNYFTTYYIHGYWSYFVSLLQLPTSPLNLSIPRAHFSNKLMLGSGADPV